MANEITKRKLQRHERGGRASFPSSNLSAEVAKINKFYGDQITGLESTRRQHESIRTEAIRARKEANTNEQNHANTLHRFYQQIPEIKIAANKVAAKTEADSYKVLIDELSRKQKMYETITGNISEPLVKGIAKATQAYRVAKAAENYEPHDFTEDPLSKAADDASIDHLSNYYDEIEEHGKDFPSYDKWVASIDVSSKAHPLHHDLRAKEFVDAKDIIIQSTREAAKNRQGKPVWSEFTLRDLLETRAEAYLRKYDIPLHSKQGIKVRQAVNLWSDEIINNISLTKAGNENINQLTTGAQLVINAVKDQDYKKASAVFNHMILLARFGVLQGGKDGTDWITPEQHAFEKPQAAAYLTGYLLKADPTLDGKGLDSLLAKLKAPLTGKLKDFKLKELGQQFDNLSEDQKALLPKAPEGYTQREAFINSNKWWRQEQAPSWGEFLGENGWTDIVGDSLTRKATGNKELKRTSAQLGAESDLAKFQARYDLPDNDPEKIDMEDYSDDGGRDQAFKYAHTPGLHPDITAGILKDLDWDHRRQTPFQAEENYKAALASGDKDEVTYRFRLLSPKSREYYKSKNNAPDVVLSFYEGGGNLEKQRNTFRDHFALKFGIQRLKPLDLPSIVDQLTDTAMDQFFDTRNQMKSLKEGDKGYIAGDKNITLEATRIVLDNIDEGIEKKKGIWRVEETGDDGTTRLRFSHFDHGQWGNRTKLAENADAFTDKFIKKGKYDAKTVADTITPIEWGDLYKAAMTGNADDFVVPENLREVSTKFKKPLNQIINDVLTNTHFKYDKDNKVISGDEDFEVEWPVSNENLISAITGMNWVGSEQESTNVLAFLNAQTFGIPGVGVRPELQEDYARRFANVG